MSAMTVAEQVVKAATSWFFMHGPAYDYRPDEHLADAVRTLLQAEGHTMRGPWCSGGYDLQESCPACATRSQPKTMDCPHHEQTVRMIAVAYGGRSPRGQKAIDRNVWWCPECKYETPR